MIAVGTVWFARCLILALLILLATWAQDTTVTLPPNGDPPIPVGRRRRHPRARPLLPPPGLMHGDGLPD